MIQDNADAIVALGNSLRTEMNDMGTALNIRIDNNVDAINQLREQIRNYMLSVDSHSKVDMIEDITISEWTELENGNCEAVITNAYFLGCTSAQVNYAQQYNIYPTYEVNGAEGTLKITVTGNPGTINISSIIVFHTSDEATISEEDLASMIMLAMELQDRGYEDLSVTEILKVMEISEAINENPDKYSIKGLDTELTEEEAENTDEVGNPEDSDGEDDDTLSSDTSENSDGETSSDKEGEIVETDSTKTEISENEENKSSDLNSDAENEISDDGQSEAVIINEQAIDAVDNTASASPASE